MSPTAYQNARLGTDSCVIVDDRPYMVKEVMNSTDPRSVKQVCWKMMAFNTTETHGASGTTTELDLLSVERVYGGATNILYRVSGWKSALSSLSENIVPDIQGDSILVRIFGAEGLIDRDEENAMFAALSRRKLAPTYWGRFQNGRLEGWCDGTRALTCKELPVFAEPIARALARLHTQAAYPPPEWNSRTIESDDRQPTLWDQMERWLQQALHCSFATPHDSKRSVDLNLQSIGKELGWLKSARIPPNAASSYCHNDLLSANILCVGDSGNGSSEVEEDVHLIDFEYGGWNFCSYDIANHFNEYAGGPPFSPFPDYSLYPTKETQRVFIRAYLQALKSTENSTPPCEKQVDSVFKEIAGFVLVNHLYWGLWSVNQAATEGCEEFDYMEYGIQRFQQYWISKEEDEQLTSAI